MRKILAVSVLASVIMLSMSASIFDYLSGDVEGREENGGPKNCICNGPSCICCLDFNISLVDLGGPGCVRLKYLSPEEGIAINVSYGESLLHNEIVKGPDPEPSCLNIFAQLAQMCARFYELLPTDDGMRGCVNLEPMLLGEAQLKLPVGCFRMGPNGMTVIESSQEVIKEQQPNEEVDKSPTSSASTDTTTEEGPETLAGFSAADILAAVNDSAEEGISLLSNWLGLTPSNQTDKVETSTISEELTEVAPPAPYDSEQSSGHVVFGSK